jgi:regulator of protease activity HflC (stomatin/prohibitin superfamily)
LRVENGIVRELATSVSTDARDDSDLSDAEGPAPASADRLWDVSHVAENAQVISSLADAKQSFQIVNMDVRFVYRLGLTDRAALAATYQVADIPALIRSTAGRVMVRDFASRTLDGLLGEQRDALARDIGLAVQTELERVSSGVEILSTLIESIHPPAGAASAYHSVQSAQITAQAIVARERGSAAMQLNNAQLAASTAADTATAAARENNAAAEVATLGFAAEQQSYRSAGPAFVRERYFSQLAEGLAKANLLIIDHRIGSGSAPTIDLRPYAAPGDTP